MYQLPDGRCVCPPPLTNVGGILAPSEIRPPLVDREAGIPLLNWGPAALNYLVGWLTTLE